MIKNRESTSRVRACESRVHPTLFALAFTVYANECTFACWNFSFHAAKKNDNAANFFVSLKQNNLEGSIGAP